MLTKKKIFLLGLISSYSLNIFSKEKNSKLNNPQKILFSSQLSYYFEHINIAKETIILSSSKDHKIFSFNKGNLKENKFFLNKKLLKEKILDKKLKLYPDLQITNLRSEKKGHFILDGTLLNFVYLNEKKIISSFGSIIYDLLKPAKDPRGEAPQKEVLELRKSFLKGYLQARSPKATSIKKLPKTWFANSKPSFLMTTRIHKFPFVIMECSEQNKTQCQIIRSCFLNKNKPLKKDFYFRGLTLLRKSNKFLVLDINTRKILIFKWTSCYNISLEREFNVTTDLKELNDMAYEASGKVWILGFSPLMRQAIIVRYDISI